MAGPSSFAGHPPFTGGAPPLAEKRFRRRAVSVIVSPFRFNDNPEVT
jgi:hypothetical protein